MSQNEIKILITTTENNEIATYGMLNLETGFISNIEDAAGLQGELCMASIFANDQQIDSTISMRKKGRQLLLQADDLIMFRRFALFEILTDSMCGAENVDTVEECPLYFATAEEALTSIEEHLHEVREAVAAGDMASEYYPSEFTIHNIQSGEKFCGAWDEHEEHLYMSQTVYKIPDFLRKSSD